jgi:hypothetical protein
VKSGVEFSILRLINTLTTVASFEWLSQYEVMNNTGFINIEKGYYELALTWNLYDGRG